MVFQSESVYDKQYKFLKYSRNVAGFGDKQSLCWKIIYFMLSYSVIMYMITSTVFYQKKLIDILNDVLINITIII